eukprot:CAMPEP_0171085760 /NCGR_PEP_ID=MMETSP0766_2-20121228/19129_1 /TAXON_ID=439317 /ORGANISM="Gambierdiscus australes, Strain CAWD 149" /LENGTH=156 /DNA_ID=CAMNT_0011543351 /DNA_START=155 /DNA_END=623 /DNA_ORIENTATION=-
MSAGCLIDLFGPVRHVVSAHCCSALAYLIWGDGDEAGGVGEGGRGPSQRWGVAVSAPGAADRVHARSGIAEGGVSLAAVTGSQSRSQRKLALAGAPHSRSGAAAGGLASCPAELLRGGPSRELSIGDGIPLPTICSGHVAESPTSWQALQPASKRA